MTHQRPVGVRARLVGGGAFRPPAQVAIVGNTDNPAGKLFDEFCSANTCQGIMTTFQLLCDTLDVHPAGNIAFYHKLKARLQTWRAQSLWVKLDKRAAHRTYRKGQACKNTRVLIIGGGPVGLRTAIEVALLGGRAVVLEKRDRFSRNNVLHLWPFLIHDLKALGAKKFFGKFCAGAIDHISIRTLQCILLKVALLVGVEVYVNTSFDELRPPEEHGSEKIGWRAHITPADHPVSEYEFEVLVGADGKRNTLPGFRRKEFRGKLAIAITANFINRNTNAEASVEEISGVAFIFNQKFFRDLNQKTGIDLENIVYYKDETHYFVMTAKKHSLLKKGVLKRDHNDTGRLLSKDNVDQEALMKYAREAADVSTRHCLPQLDYAHNHYGQPDVAMFDFTSIYAAEFSSRVMERDGCKLLTGLVGDSLLEPFWPTGSGLARGFLGAMDTAWMIRSWTSGQVTALEVLSERESIYQILSQTTPENINKNFGLHSIDPNSRYPNLNLNHFKPFQMRTLYDGDDAKHLEEILQISEQKSKKYDYIRDSHYLLKWFQRQLEAYRNTIKVFDFTASWRNGIALCSLIHKYRPELLDVYKLDSNAVEVNNQMAFDIAEKEFGIPPVMTGADMASMDLPDKLTMISYLSQFYEYFRKESIRPAKMARTPDTLSVDSRTRSPRAPRSPRSPRARSPGAKLGLLSRFSNRIRHRRFGMQHRYDIKWSSAESLGWSNDDDDSDGDGNNKRQTSTSYSMARKRMKASKEEDPTVVQRYGSHDLEFPRRISKQRPLETGVRGKNKVSALAKDLAQKFRGDGTPPTAKKEIKADPKPTKPLIMGVNQSADMCCFCGERVYLVERHSAEGVFFHRGCLKCEYCGTNLRIGQYGFQRAEDGSPQFYCLQHVGLTRPARRTMKRAMDEDEMDQRVVDDDSESDLSDSPPRSPALQGIVQADKVSCNVTPERIEYCTESEFEESELDQTQHNLSASLLSLDMPDSDSDDSTDEEAEWEGEGRLSDGDTSWANLAASYSKHISRSLKKKTRTLTREATADDDDDDTETETACESDDSWDTESETEKESEGEDSEEEDRRIRIRPIKPRVDTTPEAPPEPEEQKPSPVTQQVRQNRLSFFSAPAEPFRIDPFAFLGLRSPSKPTVPKPAEPEPPEPEPAEPEPAEPETHKEEEMSDTSRDTDVSQDNMEKVSVGEEEVLKDEEKEVSSETESSEEDETVTGSESESELAERLAIKHPIPTIEIEEVDTGPTMSEEEEVPDVQKDAVAPVEEEPETATKEDLDRPATDDQGMSSDVIEKDDHIVASTKPAEESVLVEVDQVVASTKPAEESGLVEVDQVVASTKPAEESGLVEVDQVVASTKPAEESVSVEGDQVVASAQPAEEADVRSVPHEMIPEVEPHSLVMEDSREKEVPESSSSVEDNISNQASPKVVSRPQTPPPLAKTESLETLEIESPTEMPSPDSDQEPGPSLLDAVDLDESTESTPDEKPDAPLDVIEIVHETGSSSDEDSSSSLSDSPEEIEPVISEPTESKLTDSAGPTSTSEQELIISAELVSVTPLPEEELSDSSELISEAAKQKETMLPSPVTEIRDISTELDAAALDIVDVSKELSVASDLIELTASDLSDNKSSPVTVDLTSSNEPVDVSKEVDLLKQETDEMQAEVDVAMESEPPCLFSSEPSTEGQQESVVIARKESPMDVQIEEDVMKEGFVMVENEPTKLDSPKMASEQTDMVDTLLAAELEYMDSTDGAGVDEPVLASHEDESKPGSDTPLLAPDDSPEEKAAVSSLPKETTYVYPHGATIPLINTSQENSGESPDDASTDKEVSTEGGSTSHHTSEKDVSSTADSVSYDSSAGRPHPLAARGPRAALLAEIASSSDETSYGNELSAEESSHHETCFDQESMHTKSSVDSSNGQTTVQAPPSPILPTAANPSDTHSLVSAESSASDIKPSDSTEDLSSEVSEPEKPFDVMVNSQVKSTDLSGIPLIGSQDSMDEKPSDKDSALETSFETIQSRSSIKSSTLPAKMPTYSPIITMAAPVAESSPAAQRQQAALHRIDKLMESFKGGSSDTEGSLPGSEAISIEDLDGSDLGVMEDITGEFAEEESEIMGPIVEVTVPDEKSGKDHSFTVDESFVTTRSRKKKPHRRSGHHSDSSFTISTPSGSLHSISSISEMENLPVGASLDDNISISMLVDSRETSLSIDALLETNANAEELKALWASQEEKKKDVTLVQDNSQCAPGDRTLPSRDKSLVNGSTHNNSTTLSFSTPDEGSKYHTTPDTSIDSADSYTNRWSSKKPASAESTHKESTCSPLRSPHSIMDAKRKFFFEPPQPVRIDPKSLWSDLKTPEGIKDIVPSQRRKIQADILGVDKENKVPVGGLENGTYPAEHGRTKIPAGPEMMRDWKSQDEPQRKAGGLDLRKEWQSVDAGTLSSPTAGIPHRDTVNGETDVFYGTIAPTEEVFKKPNEPKRRQLPDPPSSTSAVDASKKKYTKDEIKLLKETDRERARQDARQRARLMSDEELGIQAGDYELKRTPSLEKKSKVNKSKTLPARTQEKPVKPSQLDMTPHRPRTKGPLPKHVDFKPLPDSKSVPKDMRSASQHTRNSSDSSKSSKRTTSESSNVDSAENTPRVIRAEGVLSDTEGHSPSFLRRGKNKGKSKSGSKTPDFFREDSKSEDEKSKSNSLKKDKRKSFMSMFMSKSDKKDKVKTPKSPKEKKSDKKTPEKSEKKFGVKLRQKMKSPKPVEEENKRGSMYDEFQPLFEELGVSEVQAKTHIQERLQQVAPNLPKSTPKLAPRATAEDLDTESEFGDPDRMSIRSFQSQGMSEEDMAKMLRRQQKYAARRQREQELKRLRTAQEIQRQLEEVEIKQRDIERKGIAIERALRGEGPEKEDSKLSEEEAGRNEGQLMQEWFNVVHEKNVLVRYESELMVHARELELEDRHSRLDIQLRDLMTIEESDKNPEQKEEEKRILEELLEVVEQRNALVTLLEEDRLREQEQDKDMMQIMMGKGFQLSPVTYVNQLRPLLKDPAYQRTER